MNKIIEKSLDMAITDTPVKRLVELLRQMKLESTVDTKPQKSLSWLDEKVGGVFVAPPSDEEMVKIKKMKEEWDNHFNGPGVYTTILSEKQMDGPTGPVGCIGPDGPVGQPGSLSYACAQKEVFQGIKEMDYLDKKKCSCDGGKNSLCIICAMEMRDRVKGISTTAKRNPFYKYE